MGGPARPGRPRQPGQHRPLGHRPRRDLRGGLKAISGRLQVVVPIVAVDGAQVPWGKVVMNGVPTVSARRLPSMLRQLPAVLGPERVVDLADQARVRFHAAA